MRITHIPPIGHYMNNNDSRKKENKREKREKREQRQQKEQISFSNILSKEMKK